MERIRILNLYKNNNFIKRVENKNWLTMLVTSNLYDIWNANHCIDL